MTLEILMASAAGMLYVTASLGALFESWRESRALRVLTRRMLMLGFAVHTVHVLELLITEQVIQSAHVMSWIIALCYLLLARNARWEQFGSVFIPLVFMTYSVSFMHEARVLLGGEGTVLSWHLAVATIAVAIFLVSFINCIFYLTKDRNLKRKQIESRTMRSPSLPVIARVISRLVLLGFIALTATLLTGLWLQRDAALGAHGWLAGLAWLVYGLVLRAQFTQVQQGRQWLVLSCVGFAVITFSFLEVHGL